MKAILFDAGNTLVWLDHAFLVELLGAHGIRTSAEELLAAEYDAKRLLDALARGGTELTDRKRGEIYFAELFRLIDVPKDAFPPLAEALWARHAARGLWTVVREKTAETLDALRDAGYRLAVISNADGRVEDLLATVGLRDRFEFVLDSTEVGIEKPDPRIFHLGCERLGVDPADAVYVGDIYEIDVAGARAAGMRAFLIDPLDRWTDRDCERIAGIHELPARLEAA